MDRKEEYKKIIRKYEQDIEQLNKLKKLVDDGIITAHNSILNFEGNLENVQLNNELKDIKDIETQIADLKKVVKRLKKLTKEH